MKKTVELDKLEVASRQLNTAIQLWFSDSDPVSRHTLSCSAYQIVHDINTSRHGRDLLYDTLVIKDEYRKEFIKTLKSEYNFFKHAENDPNEIIDFNPELSITFILFTCLGLELLNMKPDNTKSAFLMYYSIKNPKILTENWKRKISETVPIASRDYLLTIPKLQFLENYLAARNILGIK